MINQNLHLKPTALDAAQHRQLKLRLPVGDWSLAQGLNALFVAAAEFGDVCREAPIVFVRAGKEPDGRDQIAPVAVLGLKQGQNLYVDEGRWRTHYMPAVLRLYPFCIGRVDDQRFAVCVDMAYAGIDSEVGAPVFEADGRPAELLNTMPAQVAAL